MNSVRIQVFVLATLLISSVYAGDLKAPVSSKEKSAREWDQAAAKQLDEEREQEAVIQKGGSASAIVNVLLGELETGEIHPIGDRESGLMSANFTALANTFLRKIGRHGDMEDLDKVVYWLYQGSGYLCDACKILNEEIHRTVIAVTNSKIKKAEAEEKKFEGGAGHQIVMDSQVKDAIKELWRNPGFYEVDKFFRDWAKDTIKGPRSGEIFSTLTQGAFGMNELLARKDVICTGMLNVCPAKPPAPSSQKMSSCRACVEGFQDFSHKLARDRKDIVIGKFDRKKQGGGNMYCTRAHVYFRLQELQESLAQFHHSSSLAKIQEVVEQIVEEHENEVVTAFVQGCKDSIGAGARAVCTDIAEVCDNDEFEEALPLTYAYHLPTAFPKTHGLDLDYTKHASHVETEL